MATCVDAGGAWYPSGESVIPTAGHTLLPLATGSARRHPDRSIFWEHEGNRAIRSGAWKLVRRFPGEWELYDMREDRTDLRNLARSEHARVREMSAAWQQWADQVGVLPWEKVSKLLQSR